MHPHAFLPQRLTPFVGFGRARGYRSLRPGTDSRTHTPTCIPADGRLLHIVMKNGRCVIVPLRSLSFDFLDFHFFPMPV